MASFTRVNFKIRVPTVRLLNVSGDMMGVMSTRDAQKLADQQGLDLVEVSPNAEPPVCKIMDYGKFRYDESIKRKTARKNQKVTLIKEVKFHASVDTHDLEHKMRQIKEFLGEGHKVKVTLQYRGRENAHKELGMEVVSKVIENSAEFAQVEQTPRLIGRTLGCMLSPKPVKPLGKGYTAPRTAAPAPKPAAPVTQPATPKVEAPKVEAPTPPPAGQ